MTRRQRNRFVFFLGCAIGAVLWWFWKGSANAQNEAREAASTATGIAAPSLQTLSDPKRTTHSEEILAEVIWRVGDAASRAHLERALAAGLELAGAIDALQLVRLRGPVDLLEEWSREVESLGYNLTLRLPPQPATEFSGRSGAAFEGNALRYLGLAERPDEWGKHVRIAVLDTGLGVHTAFDETRITRIGGDAATLDDNGHGTGVAALLVGQDTIAAGVAPGAELLVFKVLDAEGVGDAFTTAEAIAAAVDRGAKVINLSAGSSEDSAVLREAAAYAESRGVIIVAAVGNDGDGAVHYPAAYDSVVAVGAIDANGRAAAFSNTGTAVDLVAPGTGIYTAYPDNHYMEFSGTSAAAPLVSASIAALLSEERLLSATQIVDELTARADDLGTVGIDEATGNGLINPSRVLERHELNLADLGVSVPVLQPSGENPEVVTFSLNAQNRGNQFLANPSVLISINGVERVERVAGLSSGESSAVTFTIERSALLTAEGVVVAVDGLLSNGQSDAREENDGYETVLRLEPGT